MVEIVFQLLLTFLDGLLKAGSQEFKKELLIGMKIGTSSRMKVCQTIVCGIDLIASQKLFCETDLMVIQLDFLLFCVKS